MHLSCGTGETRLCVVFKFFRRVRVLTLERRTFSGALRARVGAEVRKRRGRRYVRRCMGSVEEEAGERRRVF